MAEPTRILLRQWYAGEAGALDALLERHLPAIRRQVERRLGPLLRRGAEPEDFVQEVLVEFLRVGPRIQVADDAHFRRLLARIAENVLRGQADWYRARRRDVARARPLPTETVLILDPRRGGVATPSSAAHHMEEEAWVRLGLELLEPERRDLIVQRQWEQLSFGDMGAKLGITDVAARLRYARAVDALSEVVGALRRGEVERALAASGDRGGTAE